MGPLAPPIPTNAQVERLSAQLEALPYLKRRIVLKHNRYPRFLYKYFPLNPHDEKSVDTLRDIFVRSYLWLSHHERFNDPFDLRVDVVFEGTREQKKKRFKELIENASRRNLATASRPERRAQIRAMLRRSDREWTVELNRVVQDNLKNVGVCSFAGNAKSILMWSHYGLSHEGVCLQFQIALDTRAFTYAQKVQYQEDYPRLDYVQDFDILIPMVRKHRGWKYEGEWRFLHITGADTSLPFAGESLTRIVLGCRAPDVTLACVEALLAERYKQGLPDVEVLRAKQHERKYQLQVWRVR